MAMTLFTHSPEFSILPKGIHTCKIHQNPNLRNVLRFRPFRNSKAIGSSKVVSFKSKDFGVLGLDQNFRLYGQFSVPVKEESIEEKEKQNYYVNMGYAICTLREDFPQLFCKEPGFDIYSMTTITLLAANIATYKPPRFNVLSVEELLQSISCPSTPKPTYFEISTSTKGT